MATIEEAKLEALNTLDAVKNNQLHYFDIISKASQEAIDNVQNAQIEDIKLSLVKTQSDLWANAIMDMLILTPILSVVGTAAKGMFKSALITRKTVFKVSGKRIISKSFKDIKIKKIIDIKVKNYAYLTKQKKEIYEFFGPIVDSTAQKLTGTVAASARLKNSNLKSRSVAVAGIKEDIDKWIIRNRNTTRVTFDRMNNFILSGIYKDKLEDDSKKEETKYFKKIKSKYDNLLFSLPQLPLVRSEIEKLIWLTILPEKIGGISHLGKYNPTTYLVGPGDGWIWYGDKRIVEFNFSESIANYLMNNLYSSEKIYPIAGTNKMAFVYANLPGNKTTKEKQMLKELNSIRNEGENVLQKISLIK